MLEVSMLVTEMISGRKIEIDEPKEKKEIH